MEGELAHLAYGDIDFADPIWRVCAKPGRNWTPKSDTAQRDAPVSASLTAEIAELRKSDNKTATDLIFPNEGGDPNGRLSRNVKSVAARVGLGRDKVYCHKSRVAEITRWLQEGCSPTDVVRWSATGTFMPS